jgi:hypothetical protein
VKSKVAKGRSRNAALGRESYPGSGESSSSHREPHDFALRRPAQRVIYSFLYWNATVVDQQSVSQIALNPAEITHFYRTEQNKSGAMFTLRVSDAIC